MIRKRNWCVTMKYCDPTKYSVYIEGKRFPIVWKRLNEFEVIGFR
jgi:hypothetical protein